MDMFTIELVFKATENIKCENEIIHVYTHCLARGNFSLASIVRFLKKNKKKNLA
jgi:hypothetical protein